MTITYPRAIPDNRRVSECWFDLVDNVSFSGSGNGNIINMSQVVDPYWRGIFKTGVLERNERPVWSAWRKSLRGGLRTFVAYDVRHSSLLAYPGLQSSGAISSGWNGTCNVNSIVGNVIQLVAIPTIQLKAGDRLGLEQAGKYGYYEILEDALVDGDTAAVYVTVAPFVHTAYFTTGVAVARVFRPLCQFVIDQTSWVESGTVQNEAIEFKAVQKL